MKRLSTCVAAACAALLLAAAPAVAIDMPSEEPTQDRSSRPSVMLGVAFNFGGGAANSNVGITLKLLHSDRRNRAVGAVGVTFFPWGDDVAFGLDAGIGYNFRNGAAVVSYDFLNASPQFSAGWAHTRSRTTGRNGDECDYNGSSNGCYAVMKSTPE